MKTKKLNNIMRKKNWILLFYEKILNEKEINEVFDISYLSLPEVIVFFKNYKTFKLLISLYNERGDSSFYKIIEQMSVSIRDIFLISLKNPNIEISSNGNNPYSIANKKKTFEILYKNGCDLNHKNKNGKFIIETISPQLRKDIISLMVETGFKEKKSIIYKENFYNRESLEMLIEYNLLSDNYYNVNDLIETQRPRNFILYVKNGFNINSLQLPKDMPQKYVSQIYRYMLDNGYDFYHTEDGYHPLLNGDIELYLYVLNDKKYDLIKLQDILHVNFIRENLYSKKGDGKIIEALSENGFHWSNTMPIYLDEINKNMHISLIKITKNKDREFIKLRDFSNINKSDIEKYLQSGLLKKSIEFNVGSAYDIKKIFKNNTEKKDLLEYMIYKNININRKNRNGHTLLSLFIAENMADYCDLLLKNNIREICHSIDNGSYSSNIANIDCIISKNNKIFRWEALTEETYDILKKYDLFENIYYISDLYLLSHFEHTTAFHFPSIKYDYFQKLKKDGVIIINSINFTPCTRIHYTPDLIKIIKEEGMLDIKNTDGLTALHLTKQLYTAEKLIEAGATIYQDISRYSVNISSYVQACFEKNIKKETEYLESIIKVTEENKSVKRERF